MTSQENGSVYSELKETMKYETDLLKVKIGRASCRERVFATV
jgi:hypothetical protein